MNRPMAMMALAGALGMTPGVAEAEDDSFVSSDIELVEVTEKQLGTCLAALEDDDPGQGRYREKFAIGDANYTVRVRFNPDGELSQLHFRNTSEGFWMRKVDGNDRWFITGMLFMVAPQAFTTKTNAFGSYKGRVLLLNDACSAELAERSPEVEQPDEPDVLATKLAE